MIKILNREELMKLSDLVSEVSVAQERARVMINNMENHYFGLSQEAMIVHFHENARIQADIAQDYISQMGKNLSQIEELLNQDREAEGKTGIKEGI